MEKRIDEFIKKINSIKKTEISFEDNKIILPRKNPLNKLFMIAGSIIFAVFLIILYFYMSGGNSLFMKIALLVSFIASVCAFLVKFTLKIKDFVSLENKNYCTAVKIAGKEQVRELFSLKNIKSFFIKENFEEETGDKESIGSAICVKLENEDKYMLMCLKTEDVEELKSIIQEFAEIFELETIIS